MTRRRSGDSAHGAETAQTTESEQPPPDPAPPSCCCSCGALGQTQTQLSASRPPFLAADANVDADAVGRDLGFRVVSTQSNHGKYFQMRDVWKVLTTQLHILSAVNGATGRGSRGAGS
ncbi:uncharacterized protein LOC127010842 [Drosophila biarmipes]|uniref:uncharacterized protein LOC127010842 n=1 Tax=Drosophila biarmipes TaxID=125945 RepID=UPI0021CC875A|nr:uncharacterized protein LOC127010842 [Drosophila biarmipes]